MNGQMVAKKAEKKPAAKGGHHASKKVTAKEESINDDSDQENENNEGIGHLKYTWVFLKSIADFSWAWAKCLNKWIADFSSKKTIV